MRIREIVDSSEGVLALVVSSKEAGGKVEFVTPHDFQQQVAVMNRPAGEVIAAHSHLPVPRAVTGTQEVLLIQSGRLLADIYSSTRELISTEMLEEGDIIVLARGGHGFRILEDCKIIEVKQGPYVAGKDKVIFDSGQLR